MLERRKCKVCSKLMDYGSFNDRCVRCLILFWDIESGNTREVDIKVVEPKLIENKKEAR